MEEQQKIRNNCRCLIVDQDAFSRRILQETLRYLGVTNIEEATDVGQARLLVEQSPYTLIMAEIGVPAHNCIQLITAIRQSTFFPQRSTPIIGYTEQFSMDILVKIRDAGINEIIVKPFASAMLNKKLSLVLSTPRPFIEADDYVGPCRRRKALYGFMGPLRRESDLQANMGASQKTEKIVR